MTQLASTSDETWGVMSASRQSNYTKADSRAIPDPHRMGSLIEVCAFLTATSVKGSCGLSCPADNNLQKLARRPPKAKL